ANEALVIEEGVHAIEVRGGEIVRTELGSPVIAANWERFEYMPDRDLARPRTVHLVGDFNGWAGPPSDQAIELVPRIDGTFSALLDLPAGTYHYAYLLDGQRQVQSLLGSTVIVGPTAAELGGAIADGINERGVRHEPSLASDFTPISRDIALFDIAIATLADDAEAVVLEIESGAAAVHETMISYPLTKIETSEGFDRWGMRVRHDAPFLRYRFVLRDGESLYRTPMYTAEVEPGLHLPAWAMGAVYYQIFTERFRNGEPLNDPHGPGVTPMEWTSDWYANAPDEERRWRPRAGLGLNDPLDQRQGGDLFHWIWDRRYGGDLQGVMEKLDHIQSLGVTAIYFNPVFEGDSMHKYDATAFHHIDDNFGEPGRVGTSFEYPQGEDPADPETWGWTDADRFFIDEFLPACKERGIRVVIDGVFNHTGRSFWAWQSIIERGADSPYADWFYADYAPDGSLESWQAWDGPNGWLPKFKQQPNGDLVEPVKRHLFAATKRWMDPNGDGDPSDGIDGWRLDVPLDVGLPFWEDWRGAVKSINRDAIIIAEIWSDHEADPVLTGEHFDTQMHYPFAMPVLDWLGVRPGTTTESLHRRLADEAFDNFPQTNLIHQNLFASHDTDRYVSMLFNPHRDYDQENRIQDNGPNYNDTKPDERTYRLSLLGAAIQATYLGAPMIYYGDEFGMWGADDPTNRKPVPWADQGPMKNPDENRIEDWPAEYARLFQLRHEDVLGDVLRYGNVRPIDAKSDDLFAVERMLNGNRALVVINKSDRTSRLAKQYVQTVDRDIARKLSVPGLSARVFLIESAGSVSVHLAD
ncbi:MAG: alpha-amylase family glycosyl hydrolase, partial [Planctomycetota bacterium]